MKLLLNALLKLVFGLFFVGLLVFLPVGTFDYPEGRRFIAVLFIPMLILGVILLIKAPELLEKRLNSNERRGEQRLVVKLSGFMFIVGFILAGLDYRFGWLVLPDAVSRAATAVFLIGYALYAEVMRENAYLSRTVEVQVGQRVIDTGLYGLVRHPMYFSTVLMFCSMPLVLGSLVSLAVFIFYPFLLVKRIKNEEALLEAELEGYREYKSRVKYRLIPYIW